MLIFVIPQGLAFLALVIASSGASGRAAPAAPPAVPDTTVPPASVDRTPPPSIAPIERHPSAALLERIGEAVGGRKAVSAVEGIQVRARILPLVDGPSATLRYELALSGLMREETRSVAGADIRWLEGRLAWIGVGEKRAKAAPLDVAADLRYRFHELAAPIELARTPAESLAELGSAPDGCTRLVRRFGAERLAYDVDPNSGRLRRVVRLSETGETLAIELDDYRTSDGVTYPFRWTTIDRGIATSETIVGRVARIDSPRPSDFLPPNASGGL